jgi:hypothetical protein
MLAPSGMTSDQWPRLVRKAAAPSIGRPTLYKWEYCQRIIDAMAMGLSVEAAAAKIGVSARSLYYWQKEYPEFLQAIQEGRHKSQLWWELRAIALANGKAGNAQIVMLGLRNRSRAASGWNNESVRLEHPDPDCGPVIVEPKVVVLDASRLTHEQREDLRSILLTAKNGSKD